MSEPSQPPVYQATLLTITPEGDTPPPFGGGTSIYCESIPHSPANDQGWIDYINAVVADAGAPSSVQDIYKTDVYGQTTYLVGGP